MEINTYKNMHKYKNLFIYVFVRLCISMKAGLYLFTGLALYRLFFKFVCFHGIVRHRGYRVGILVYEFVDI